MTFKYQEWKKQESEQRIISSLSEGDKSFSELLKLTDLSKPVLSRRLKELKEKGKIDVVPDKETKRFLYRLIQGSLDEGEKIRLRISRLTKILLAGLEKTAQDRSISDDDYLNIVDKVMTDLLNLRLRLYLPYMSFSEQKEWWRNTFGSEFVSRLPYMFPSERLESLKDMIAKVTPEEYVASLLKRHKKKKD